MDHCDDEWQVLAMTFTWCVVSPCCTFIMQLLPVCFRSAKSLFDLEYLGDGKVAMRAANDKYVSAHFNGSLCAINDSLEAKNRFYMTLVNRPVLVLMCDYGFVGAKTAGSARLECNKAHYDYIFVEHTNGESGVYYLKGEHRLSPYLSIMHFAV